MDFQKEYQKWLDSGVLTATEKAELEAIKDAPKEIESRFYGPLEFGTAGLRGTMAVGLHHMNLYVVRHATQAFADIICAEGDAAKEKGVAICMDCRNHGMEFAQAAAGVCAANGIKVRIFESLRPTPELSFAVRHYGCQAGINVTASHNPKEYNGYKVYWEDGAQLPPQHASAIAARLEEIDIFTGIKTMPYDEAVKAGMITVMGEETDEAFLQEVMAMVTDTTAIPSVADSFKLVYTPFHGCGHKLVPEALKRAGIKHLLCVPEQMVIDGNFPTVDGEYKVMTGNQTGVVLLDYLLGAMGRTGKLPANPVALKTIVTTEMAKAVAESYGAKCYDTFTGFKFIAEKKNALEGSGEGKVVFSYEESYGYMLGDYVRDKDAVTASLLAKLMKSLRETPPAAIGGVQVAQFKDYADGSVLDCATGAKTTMELSGSNVLRFELADGTSIIVRPSGTEPKIKVYILTKGADAAERDANVKKYSEWVETLKK